MSCFAALSWAHVVRQKARLICFLCQLNVSSALVRGMWGSVKPWKGWERMRRVGRWAQSSCECCCSQSWEPSETFGVRSSLLWEVGEPETSMQTLMYPKLPNHKHFRALLKLCLSLDFCACTHGLSGEYTGRNIQPWVLRNEDRAYWFSFSIYPEFSSQSCDL